MKTIDITNITFSRLTAIEPTGKSIPGEGREWLFNCSCGNKFRIVAKKVRSGNTKSCGCLSRDSNIQRCRKDMAGKVVGRLTVLRYDRTEAGKVVFWLCQCECGEVVSVRGASLRFGHTNSCGCLAREATGNAARKHGRSKTKTYAVWKTMRQRCSNPNDANYHYYGGRGVSVCGRWESFEAFIADMGEAPKGLTLDRIDPNGNYEPGNCRWATWAVQRHNRRDTNG